MTFDPHGTENIPIGTAVTGFDGALIGYVRETHAHYLLVGQEGQHEDLEVPVHAIRGFSGDTLQVSVTRESVTAVDDVETTHRQGED